MAPHKTARPSVDRRVIERVQSTFSISNVMEVNVGVTEGFTSHRVATHANRGNRTNLKKWRIYGMRSRAYKRPTPLKTSYRTASFTSGARSPAYREANC